MHQRLLAWKAGLVYGSQNFGFLYRGRFAPGDAHGPQQDRAVLRDFRFQIVALLQPAASRISRGRVICAARRTFSSAMEVLPNADGPTWGIILSNDEFCASSHLVWVRAICAVGAGGSAVPLPSNAWWRTGPAERAFVNADSRRRRRPKASVYKGLTRQRQSATASDGLPAACMPAIAFRSHQVPEVV